MLRGGPALRQKETMRNIAEGNIGGGVQLATAGIAVQGIKGDSKTAAGYPEAKKSDKIEKSEMAESVTTAAAEEPGDFASIPLVAANMSSNDWKVRVEAIDTLMGLAEKDAETLQLCPKFVLVLEALVKGLSDSNSKVSLKAVSALERFVPLFKTGIEQHVTLLLGGLCNNICSTNVPLKNKSDIIIDLLIDTIESVYLAQPFVHLALYGNARARPTIVLHLCGTLNGLRDRHIAGDS